MPRLTIGAKEKWQSYLGDLSIMIWVRYHTHTHTHTHRHTHTQTHTYTRPCAINTKRKKIKKVKDVIVKKQKKKNGKPEELWC